jgi:hypothetical protein
MDGDKIRKDFEEFLSKHPETITEKHGRRLFISRNLSMFCFEYDYPLNYARKELKRLGVISDYLIYIRDPETQSTVTCYGLDGRNSIPEGELVREARQIIDRAPKIVWETRIWIRKQHLLYLCEKYGISYYRLIMILRKHGLVAKTRTIYDREVCTPVNSAEVLCDEWERRIVENAKELLKEKLLEGEFVAQDDLFNLAKSMNMDHRDLVNLLKKNGLIENHMVVFKMKEIQDERDKKETTC